MNRHFVGAMAAMLITSNLTDVYAMSFVDNQNKYEQNTDEDNFGDDSFLNVDDEIIDESCEFYNESEKLTTPVEDNFSASEGSETNVIALTVEKEGIQITEQPTDVTAKAGEAFAVQVKAEGTKLKYRWKYRQTETGEWKDFSYATGATLSKKMLTSWNGWQVKCVITDANGNSAESNVVNLAVEKEGIQITERPADVTAKAGEAFTVQVKAEGTKLKYQWKYRQTETGEWKDFSYATGATLSKKMLTSWNGWQVKCVITDANGNSAESNVVNLAVEKEGIQITERPADVTAKAGEAFTVQVKAEGTNLQYQWQYYETKRGTWESFRNEAGWSNPDGPDLIRKMRVEWDGLQVRCWLMDEYGNIELSNTIKLHLDPRQSWSIENRTLTFYGEIGNTSQIDGKDEIEEIVIKNATKIPDKAFEGWKNLKTVSIAKSVKKIGSSAFSECRKLNTVVFSKGLEEIGAHAFREDIQLTSVDIPYGVTTLGVWAFGDCYSLKKVNLPATITNMGSAFAGRSQIRSLGPQGGNYDLEYNWMELIPYEAFEGMKSLRTAVVDKVEGIGAYAFSNCTTLKTVLVEGGVWYIESGAFYGDYYLDSVNISKDLKAMGPYEIFDGCGENLMISCQKDSYIWEWAKLNNIKTKTE